MYALYKCVSLGCQDRINGIGIGHLLANMGSGLIEPHTNQTCC